MIIWLKATGNDQELECMTQSLAEETGQFLCSVSLMGPWNGKQKDVLNDFQRNDTFGLPVITL